MEHEEDATGALMYTCVSSAYEWPASPEQSRWHWTAKWCTAWTSCMTNDKRQA